MSGLVQPTAWRLMLVAFALWAINFLGGYGAALLAPGALATRLVIAGLAVASLIVLGLLARRASAVTEASMVRASLLVAGLAILFNGATAFA